MRHPLVLLCVLALLATEAQAKRASSSLDGDWTYKTGELSYTPALLPVGSKMKVPSNWYQEGLDTSGVVWFFREVNLPDDGRWAVSFEGVDYSADVYWDGKKIGSHRGYFAPFSVEVPSDKKSAKHLLAVRVDSPIESPQNFSLHKTLIKGVLSHHDTRPGGAWSDKGQDANTGGIWGEVQLTPIELGQLSAIKVSTVDYDTQKATLEISASVSNLKEDATLEYLIWDPKGNLSAQGTLASLSSSKKISKKVKIYKPTLWQPYELGDPALYQLEVRLKAVSGGAGDIVKKKFGIRTISQDNAGRILLNKSPFFLRGTNYIPTIYLSSMSEEEIRADLVMMKEAHINTIRIHAHIAAGSVYDLADEMGFLIYQDFPLQWGYIDSADFTKDASIQLREMLDTLGYHPSIIFWTAHNEAPWSSDWMIYKYPSWDPDQNRSLDLELAKILREEDPYRPSQTNSHPTEHAWMGWYFGTYRDFEKPMFQPIITEYGAQAVPEVATLKTFLKPEQLWPLTGDNLDTWEYHNFQLKELTQIAKVPLGNSVEELVQNTQGYQARLTQFAAESMRRQKWQPIAGIFEFMFVEHWASSSWGVVDYKRKPKLGYAALARAYQPILATAVQQQKNLSLYIINDTHKKLDGATLIATYSGESEEEYTGKKFVVDITDNGVIHLPDTLSLPEKNQSLVLQIQDKQGLIVSENLYEENYFELTAKAK